MRSCGSIRRAPRPQPESSPLCAFSPATATCPIQMPSTRSKRAPTRPSRANRCFLYAELVQQMTELSIRQYAAGDVEKATGLLKHIQQYRAKNPSLPDDNDKRLKNAEMLLSHTAFRLNEMLHASKHRRPPAGRANPDPGDPGAKRGLDAGLPQVACASPYVVPDRLLRHLVAFWSFARHLSTARVTQILPLRCFEASGHRRR